MDEFDHNWKNWKTKDQNGKNNKVWKSNWFNWETNWGEKIELRENWLDLQVNGQNKRDEKFWNSNYSIKGLIEEKK